MENSARLLNALNCSISIRLPRWISTYHNYLLYALSAVCLLQKPGVLVNILQISLIRNVQRVKVENFIILHVNCLFWNYRKQLARTWIDHLPLQENTNIICLFLTHVCKYLFGIKLKIISL